MGDVILGVFLKNGRKKVTWSGRDDATPAEVRKLPRAREQLPMKAASVALSLVPTEQDVEWTRPSDVSAPE
ncbi:MAG: hypothetical protein RLZZ416_7 [Candidatus Parcubacteria bacterium]